MKRPSSPVNRDSSKRKTFLRGLLTPPAFTDPQENDLAQTLYYLLVFTTLVSGSYAVLTWFIATDPSGALLSGGMMFISACLLLVLRRGKIRLVSHVLIISGYVTIMITLFMNGGLRD